MTNIRRQIPIFNYKTKDTGVKPLRKDEKTQRQTIKFLDINYGYSIPLDYQDKSNIDIAKESKHKIKGSYQSKEATKRGRFQSIL